MATFYHGSSVLFDKFDLSYVLTGAGKVKFGYGVNLTSSYSSAAHYSGADKDAENHFVYTVEVPDLTDTNHIEFKQSVHPEIIKKAEEKLNIPVPDKVKTEAKDFRKFLAKFFEEKILTGLPDNRPTDRSLHLTGEQAASEFLNSIGVLFITWPYSWKNPKLGINMVVVDESKIKIIRIDKVELDGKQKLLKGSEREVTL